MRFPIGYNVLCHLSFNILLFHLPFNTLVDNKLSSKMDSFIFEEISA